MNTKDFSFKTKENGKECQLVFNDLNTPNSPPILLQHIFNEIQKNIHGVSKGMTKWH